MRSGFIVSGSLTNQRSGLAIRPYAEATPFSIADLSVCICVMVAVRGRPSGLPGVSVTRIANLRTAATFTCLAMSRGGLNPSRRLP
ncbi:ash family protein [Pseudomonas sp. COW3]|nr:ash family protein [Pseudomonas botevensis]